MSTGNWISVAIAVAEIVLVPFIIAMIRYTTQTHKEIASQMKYDRDATNTRLRYLEEFFMTQAANVRPRR
jgi:hypothetical protein